MNFRQSVVPSARRAIPVPVMLQMLHLLEQETHSDMVLSGVARTLSQAIDELTALQRTAHCVMLEVDGQCALEGETPVERRRLC